MNLKRFQVVRQLTTILIFTFAAACLVNAQSESPAPQLHRIELTDGSVFIGRILSEDQTTIKFKTVSEVEIAIQKSQIRKQEIIRGELVEGRFWRNDPNRTRLLFSPTGRALKSGQGYFSIYEIFFPFVAVGITDWLALSGGFTIFPGAESQLLYFAPKITPVRAERFDLSAGVLLIKIPEEEDMAGILYGVGTHGTEKAALTVGLGFAFGGGDIADKPVFVLGGEVRSSRSIKFITENWLIPDSDVQLLSAGIRFFGENLAADFALFYPAGADTEGFPFVPWIGFSYNFGSEK